MDYIQDAHRGLEQLRERAERTEFDFPEPAQPLEGFSPAIEREERPEAVTPREAAQEVSDRRRNSVEERLKATLLTASTSLARWTRDGAPLDPKKTFRANQHDLRRVSPDLTDYRKEAGAWLDELRHAEREGRDSEKS
jgi:hypothetical protein